MGRHKLPAGPGRPRGAANKATREIKAFTEQFLSSPQYVESAKRRVMAGRAPHLEVLWHHYAYGKPKETVEVNSTVPPFILKIDAGDLG